MVECIVVQFYDLSGYQAIVDIMLALSGILKDYDVTTDTSIRDSTREFRHNLSTGCIAAGRMLTTKRKKSIDINMNYRQQKTDDVLADKTSAKRRN